jgi:hypothetical protein
MVGRVVCLFESLGRVEALTKRVLPNRQSHEITRELFKVEIYKRVKAL